MVKQTVGRDSHDSNDAQDETEDLSRRLILSMGAFIERALMRGWSFDDLEAAGYMHRNELVATLANFCRWREERRAVHSAEGLCRS